MNDHQLLRYSKHLFLDSVGFAGQERLLASHVLIVGAGGLGCAASMYLAAAGVGQLTVIDDDAVELSNLQRQIAFDTADIGLPKVQALANRLQQLNPDVRINAVSHRLDDRWLQPWITQHQPTVIVDCTDNFNTRFTLNRLCRQTQRPWVSGAAIGSTGQVITFTNANEHSPCYACLYSPTLSDEAHDTCAQNGVLAPLVGVIGGLQALHTMHLITKANPIEFAHQLCSFDAMSMQWRRHALTADNQCSVCMRPTI